MIGVYWQVRSHPFVRYDDLAYVADNPHVRAGFTVENVKWAFTSREQANWHPLTWLSHMLDCQLFGPDEAGCHHLVNLLLHAVNAALLYFVLARITGTFWRASLVAALFALHPLQVESVAWIAQRKTLLSTLFGLLCLHAYVAHCRRRGYWWYVVSLLMLVLGLMAKPMLVTIPMLLLVLDHWPLKRVSGVSRELAVPVGQRSPSPNPSPRGRGMGFGALVAEKIPMLLVVVVVSAVTFLVQHGGGAVGSVPFGHRLATIVTAYVRYVGKTFWPANLAVLYPNHPDMWHAGQVGGAIALLLAVSAVVFVLRRRRYLTVGWLWFAGTLVPVIGIVQIGEHSMADRYMYVPFVGLLIMVVWGAADFCGRHERARLAIAVAAAAWVVACGCLTAVQAGTWRDSETLFRHAIAVTAGNHSLHKMLGDVLRRRGRADEAVEHYGQALQIKYDFADAHTNLGAVLHDDGRFDEALHHLRRAVRLDPRLFEAHVNLGITLHAQGQTDNAAAHYATALQLAPDNADAHYNLGVLQHQLERLDDAIRSYEQALRAHPTDAEAHNNLGVALSAQGRDQRAIGHFRQALALNDQHTEAHYNLGNTLSGLGRVEKAIVHYEAALRLDPESFQTHANLAVALETLERWEDAIDHWRTAVRLNPENDALRTGLAGAEAMSGR